MRAPSASWAFAACSGFAISRAGWSFTINSAPYKTSAFDSSAACGFSSRCLTSARSATPRLNTSPWASNPTPTTSLTRAPTVETHRSTSRSPCAARPTTSTAHEAFFRGRVRCWATWCGCASGSAAAHPESRHQQGVEPTFAGVCGSKGRPGSHVERLEYIQLPETGSRGLS